MKNIILLLILQFSALAFSQQGSLDTTFNPGTGSDQPVFTISLQSDGKIIIGGEFTNYNGTDCNRIARLNTDGTLDKSFNIGKGADNSVNSTLIQADGKIIIAGSFKNYNGIAINRVARLNADGSLDTSFNVGAGADDTIQIVLIQSDGKIVLGGKFKNFNGIAGAGVVRLNADGSLDKSFNVGTGADDNVLSAAIQSDGKIVIGGYFQNYNGTPINRIARLNTDGSLDSSFNVGSGTDDVVYTISIQSNGKIIIGGNFTTYNGNSKKHITCLNPDGSLDTVFNSGAGTNQVVYTTTIQTDGKIIVGGLFTNYNGTASNFLIRLNPDGSVDNSFNVGKGADNGVSAITVQTDGRILIGGYFSKYDGTSRNRIARINNMVLPPKASPQSLCTGATVADLVAAGTDLQWYTTQTGGSALSPSTVLVAGTYYVSQTVGTIESARATVPVTINPPITPIFTQINPICSGDTLSALPVKSDNGISGSWSLDVDNTVTTTYTFTPTAGSCGTSAQMTIAVKASPDIELNHEDAICLGNKSSSVQINAGLISGSQSDNNYQWFKNGAVLPGSQNYYLTASSDGVYTCVVTNKVSGCQKTRTDTVTYSEPIVIKDVVVSDLTSNNTVTVVSSDPENSEYSLDDPTGPFQDSNVFENVEPGIHEVYVNDKKGCGSTSKTIAVTGAPAFFTPNGDGVNDRWKLKGANAVFNKDSTVEIFDRYGKLIKVLSDAESDGWDGTYNGALLPADDYWFVVNMEDGREVKGHFSLKR